MTGGAPPDRQCTLPGCTREATDPEIHRGLCAEHFKSIDDRGENGGNRVLRGGSGDEPPGGDAGKHRSPAEARRVFADRLREADLDTKRFIDVHDGEKRSTDHTQREHDAPELSGNYGVYGGAGAGEERDWVLVDVDVDDYEGERAPDWIPETLTVASPHTDGDSGGHFYLALPAGVGEDLEAAFGTANPALEWGEVRVHNQYCVGPGSQLDGCGKEWCDDCADPDGGYYRLKADEPIAHLGAEEFVAALEEDMPDRESEISEPTAPAADADGEGEIPDNSEIEARLEAAFANKHDGDRIKKVYDGRYRAAGFDDRSGAEFWLANRLDSWVGLGRRHVVESLMDRANLQKWPERPDRAYRDSTLKKVGFQDWYYEPDKGDDPDDAYQPDPTDLEVTLNPAVAYRGATSVTPDDLEDDLDVPTTDDGEGWRDPETGATIDVVQAVALSLGFIETAKHPLSDTAYDRAYRRAREVYNAPLPEYVTAEMATDNWHVIQGAVRQLEHHHFASIHSEVTAAGGGDAVAEINPIWADSASERRVVAFDSGTFYCREHDRTIDPLRFVALEAGLIADCDAGLEGEAFRRAYNLAREEYGAPLPEWTVGDPSHIPVLPPAEDLLGEFATDTESLDAARNDVEALYRELADHPGADVLTALPATGKSTSAVKTAADTPTLYVARRKELMQETADKAAERGISYMHLPVFATAGPRNEAVHEGVHAVREHGQGLLENRGELPQYVDGDVMPSGDPDPDDDEIHLERASCPTANGDHGEQWALAVHVARELGYSPRDIHRRATSLFGEELPCCPDCTYSRAWERATDPDAPVDLLIGHYTHAHVGGARTYYHRDDDRVVRDPRAVAIDEFPGDTYAEKFGPEAFDMATWLASCLSEDVEALEDLFDHDLWSDEVLRQWLQGAVADWEEVEPAKRTLERLQRLLEILESVEELLEHHPDALHEVGLYAPLEGVWDVHPKWGKDDAYSALRRVREALDDVGRRTHPVVADVGDDVADPLSEILTFTTDEYDSLGVETMELPDRFGGDLEDMVADAVTGFREQWGAAPGLIEATLEVLKGGEAGCRALALHADDPYAHPLAYLLLYGVLADGEAETVIDTGAFAFDPQADDGTQLSRSELGRSTLLVDRNHHGVIVQHPPEFTSKNGADNPVVGLDATGRERLWSLALGRGVRMRDIHTGRDDREEFLRDVLNLQVVQTTHHVNSYEGSPSGKNFDGDLALVEAVAGEYGHHHLRPDRFTTATRPGVITTKNVKDHLGDALEDRAGDVANYGDITGSNDFDRFNLGVVLGCQHYGDDEVEKWAALAGEEVTRTGRGSDLEYGCPTGDEFLEHMREDQTMQAILRFGRDEEGAIVFAHTAALRDDLPVVGEGAIVSAHSKSMKAVATAAKEHVGGRFTVSDIAPHVECERRTVRRALARLADLGYIRSHDPGEGLANSHRLVEDPGSGEAELPELGPEGPPTTSDPGQTPSSGVYTWNVQVQVGEPGDLPLQASLTPQLPAPEAAQEGPPPD